MESEVRVQFARACKDDDSELVRELLFNNLELLSAETDAEFLNYIVNLATCSNNSDIVKHVVKFIRFEAKDDFMKQLITALLENDLEFAELLLKNSLLIDMNNKHLPSVYYSLFRGKTETRKQLLLLLMEYGLDTRFQYRHKRNILHEFCSITTQKDYNAVEIAEVLIDSGTPINEVDDERWTPLHRSIMIHNIPLILLLIKKGAEINCKSNIRRYKPPLHLATDLNDEEVVDLLLSNGAEINLKDCQGLTALHQACFLGYKKIVSLLIQKGADISVEDERRITPFSWLVAFDGTKYQKCMMVMVKEFSKLNFENHAVSGKDMSFIQKIPEAQEYFEKCTQELKIMSSTKFYGPYTYYSVLTMSMKKLSNLTRNEEFVTGFQENIGQFSEFENDLINIFQVAVKDRDESEAVLTRLILIFGKTLIQDVLRILARNLTLEDLPLE